MFGAFRLPLSIASFWLITVFTCNAQNLNAETELDLGVSAYKQAKYEDAIRHFEKAAALDPTSVTPHLYLGTAYAQQYLPGADNPYNNQIALQSVTQFEQVLALNSTLDQRLSSLKGIASLYFNMKKWDSAKEYHRKVLSIDPDDSETYYAIGVIDWTEAYQPRMEVRAKIGLKADKTLINTTECWDIRAKNEERVKEAIEMLTKAISLRSDYDDAMAYMNLMYRERADIQCGNGKANADDIRTADKWVDVTIATKKAKADRNSLKLPQEQN